MAHFRFSISCYHVLVFKFVFPLSSDRIMWEELSFGQSVDKKKYCIVCFVKIS